MEYQFKSYSKGSKKKSLPSYIFVILYCSWLAYLFLSLYLGDNIVLFEWFPKWAVILFFLFSQGLLGEYGTLSFAHQSMLSVIIIGGLFLAL